MNGSAVCEPVETLYGKGGSIQHTDLPREVAYRVQIDELQCRHIHADHSGERHHRKLVLGHALEFA